MGGGQVFCDDITKAVVLKSVTMGEGIKNFPKYLISLMDDLFASFQIKAAVIIRDKYVPPNEPPIIKLQILEEHHIAKKTLLVEF